MTFTAGQKLRVDYGQAFAITNEESPEWHGAQYTMSVYDMTGRPYYGEIVTVAEKQMNAITDMGGTMVILEGVGFSVPVGTSLLVDAETPIKNDSRLLLRPGDKVMVNLDVNLADVITDPIMYSGVDFLLDQMFKDPEWVKDGESAIVQDIENMPDEIRSMTINLGGCLIKLDRNEGLRVLPSIVLSHIIDNLEI